MPLRQGRPKGAPQKVLVAFRIQATTLKALRTLAKGNPGTSTASLASVAIESGLAALQEAYAPNPAKDKLAKFRVDLRVTEP